MTPFWLVALVPVLDRFQRGFFAKAFTLLLVFGSIYSAWQPIDNPWRQPWLFQWMETRGWIDYSDTVPELKQSLWTWFASLPETTQNQPAYIEFEVVQPSMTKRIIRMTARTATSGSGTDRVEIEVRESLGDGSEDRIQKFQIDKAKFSQGLPPADFLFWNDPKVTEQKQQADFAFVRGLPRKVPFTARTIRYLKTPIRQEAFKCQLAAAHVAYSAKDGESPLVYRCDTWLTDDVPFGVAQVEFRITHPDNGTILLQERWTVHDCWPKALPYRQQ
jgi:hypothetical protein